MKKVQTSDYHWSDSKSSKLPRKSVRHVEAALGNDFEETAKKINPFQLRLFQKNC